MLKLFAAAFLSGASDLFEKREATIVGRQVIPGARNAALGGAQEVLNAYAQQIAETIHHEGTFVRVAAGKEFYLYLTQSLDRSKAKLAGTRNRPEISRLQTANPIPPLSLKNP